MWHPSATPRLSRVLYCVCLRSSAVSVRLPVLFMLVASLGFSQTSAQVSAHTAAWTERFKAETDHSQQLVLIRQEQSYLDSLPVKLRQDFSAARKTLDALEKHTLGSIESEQRAKARVTEADARLAEATAQASAAQQRLDALKSKSLDVPPSSSRSAVVDGQETLIRGAVLTVQRTLQASGIESQEISGVWTANTLKALTEVLAALQQDEVWGDLWEGPRNGIYTKELAEHLQVVLEVNEELKQNAESTQLMRPFLAALDLLKSEGIYRE